MSDRVSNFAVGLFVLAALAVLIVGSLWILGSSAIVGERYPYQVLMDDSAGVEVGDRVRLAGVSVGRIRDITLQPEQEWPVRLDIDVRTDVELRRGTTATIATIGLMGATFLQLVPGPLGEPGLETGGTMLGSGSAGFDAALDQVDVLSSKLAEVLDQTSALLATVSAEIEPLLDRFEKLLSDDNIDGITGVLNDIPGVLASAEDTLNKVEPRVGPLLEQMESMAANVTQSTTALPELTSELTTLVDSLNQALGPDGQRVIEVLSAAEGTLGSADEALAVLSNNRAVIERMLVDMQDAMANLERFSRTVRQRPSSLVRGGAPADRKPGDPAEGGGR